MSQIQVTVSREVTDEEVHSMITGTGALSWDWWLACDHGDDGWTITHWDQGSEGEKVTKTTLTADQICEAFGELITLEYVDPAHSDTKDAINESLGYLDAVQADMVLQWAVFRELVYG